MKSKPFLIFMLVFIITSSCERLTGPEGKKSLIKLIQEPPGINCSSGGIRVASGIDNNGNDILDEDEYQVNEYICNGANGLNSLLSITGEQPGTFCETGGYKISSGIDLNNNKILDSIEVQNIEYICHGNAGLNSIYSITEEEPGIKCTSGGMKISSGIDLNNNSVLDSIEIQYIEYVCHGNAGLNSLYSITEEEPGINCTAGGIKISLGIDQNNNNILDSIEIQDVEYICHGSTGLNSIYAIAEEGPGSNCAAGGLKVFMGIDLNNNIVLDDDEVQDTMYICHGSHGLNSLSTVSEEDPGSNCDAGGLKISSGLDLNNNSILENPEVLYTEYICNGRTGYNSLISSEPEEPGTICMAGGYKIFSGIDSNNNLVLDSTEIQYVEYVCHGIDGKLDRQIMFDFNIGGSGYGSWSQSIEVCNSAEIRYFDLNNYPDVDSISFSADLRSTASNAFCIVELFNLTDNVTIHNSEIRSNALEYELVTADINLITEIPVRPISLGIRMRTSQENVRVDMKKPFLILYRKKASDN